MSSMEAGLVPRKYPSEAGGLRAARHGPHGHSASARTAHSMSASALRKKSDASLVRKVPFAPLRPVLANLQEVFLGTKLAVLFPAVPLAIAAQCRMACFPPVGGGHLLPNGACWSQGLGGSPICILKLSIHQHGIMIDHLVASLTSSITSLKIITLLGDLLILGHSCRHGLWTLFHHKKEQPMFF